jgi:hypothetical protein
LVDNFGAFGQEPSGDLHAIHVSRRGGLRAPERHCPRAVSGGVTESWTVRMKPTYPD